MKQKPTILVVDDEAFVRDSLIALLEAEQWRTLAAPGAAPALKRLSTERVDVVITDLNMPDGDGHSLLKEAQRLGVRAPIIVLTGVGKIADAVEAMRHGAYDFIQKPIEPAEFLLLVRRALKHTELVGEVRRLRDTVQTLRGGARLVGASPWYKELQETLAKIAPADVPVLVTGESGTGKELVAQEIHLRSPRAAANLVRVNCAAITETLFESEFFGHRRGAFTGAAEDRAGRFSEADGGTLVLDEVGTLRPGMQAKLLRVLESGEYQVVGESSTRVADARVVAVTNEDLRAAVARGDFRADLFYRLCVFPIHVPPLRQRREDIAPLAQYLHERALLALPPRDSEAPRELDAAALEVLGSHDWPGNVRELRNVIERAAILAASGRADADLFRRILESALVTGNSGPAPLSASGETDLRLRTRLDALEGELIRAALARTGGAKREAALLLGIDPKNMGYYLRKHQGGDEPGARKEGT